MGQLTDNAQKKFKRMSRVHVPEWFATGQVAALIAIPLLVVVSYFVQSGEGQPSLGSNVLNNGGGSSIAVDQGEPALPTDNGTTNSGTTPVVNDAAVSVRRPGGGAVDVPSSALAVARAAGIASYTGNWDGVALTGARPVTQQIYPNAKVGEPLAYSVSDNAITFAFSLDRDGNGSTDMSFQISVVNISGSWVFPASGA